MLKLIVSDKVKFPVEGTYKDETGVQKKFDFKLLCKRLNAEELESRRVENPDEKIIDFLLDVVEDWEGIRDADSKPIPFSADAFRQLCALNGLESLIFVTYRIESGVKAKN